MRVKVQSFDLKSGKGFVSLDDTIYFPIIYKDSAITFPRIEGSKKECVLIPEHCVLEVKNNIIEALEDHISNPIIPIEIPDTTSKVTYEEFIDLL